VITLSAHGSKVPVYKSPKMMAKWATSKSTQVSTSQPTFAPTLLNNTQQLHFKPSTKLEKFGPSPRPHPQSDPSSVHPDPHKKRKHVKKSFYEYIMELQSS